jgi:hypothetical protein
VKAPALWRRKIGGELIGSFHVTIKGKRVNLRTKDAETARKRRASAVRGVRTFEEDDSVGAAEKLIAVLDAVPPPPGGGAVEGAALADGPRSPPVVAPPLLALAPMPPASSGPERVEAEPIEQPSASSWTEDATAAAGQALPGEDAPPAEGAERATIGDLPMFAEAFVLASRIAVQLQMLLQAMLARKIFKFDLPVLADPPPKDLGQFMEQQGKPWPKTDPREAGRAQWEKFARRVCPTELPIPDWVAAPLLVAVGTLPVQFMHGSKIDPNAPPVAAAAAADPSTSTEAPAGDIAA